MQITPFNLYLISRLDNISHLFVALAIIFNTCAIVTLFLSFAKEFEDKDLMKLFKHLTKRLIIGSLIFNTAACFTPTTKEMAAILVIPQIANNQEVQGLGSDIIQLARDWVIELKPKQTK